MGVYIKDLKKPENCDVCPIFLVFTTCGLDRDHCMFQEVPEPHGRLIDADALRSVLRLRGKEFSNSEYGEGVKCGLADAREFIKIAPTIIPAEEGET